MEEKQQLVENQTLDISRFTIPLRDDFAIGFAEWILDNYDSDDASKFKIFYTNNMIELLEIYKKEKGL